MEHQAKKSLTATRPIIVAFRLTAVEAAHIETAGAALKQPRTRADFCRAIALHAARQRVPEPTKPVRLPPRRLPTFDTQLLCKTLAELGKLGSNLNQLARIANNRGTMPTVASLAEISNDIVSIRFAISQALRGGVMDNEPKS